MSSADEKTYIEPEDDNYVSLKDDDGNYVCDIKIYNDTNDDVSGKDAKFIKIAVEDDWHELGNRVEFAGGIKLGDKITVEELVEMFGEYDDTYTYDSSVDEEYSYTEYTWGDYDEVQFTVAIGKVSGCVKEITIDADIY